MGVSRRRVRVGRETVVLFSATLAAQGLLFPQPGVKPKLPAEEARSLNHWAAREDLEQRIKLPLSRDKNTFS